jgi:DNA-binding MarR family transcriptional regulator
MRTKVSAAAEAAEAPSPRQGRRSPRARRRAPVAAPAKGIDQDQPFDLYRTPGHMIRRLHQIVVSLCYEGWGTLAISPVQYGALMAIRAFPGIDQRGLSRAIAIDRSTIGTVGEQLERRGLIERRTGTRDKRNKELFLTAEGAALLRRAHPLAWEIQDRVLAPLAPKERREFVRLLAKLVESNNALSRAPLGPTGFEAD